MTTAHTPRPTASYGDPRIGAIVHRASDTLADACEEMRVALMETVQSPRDAHGLHTIETITREARRYADLAETIADARRTLLGSLSAVMTQDELASIASASPRSIARHKHRIADILAANPAEDFELDAEGRWSLRQT